MTERHVFDAAVTGIAPEDIADAERYIGVPLRIHQFNREATLDTIYHYAHGMGDLNPLWSDAEYAATGPHGDVVAPPCFLYSVFAAGITPGFPGLQVFFGGGEWTWHRPIRRGDEIRATAKLTGMREKSGRNVKRMIIQDGLVTYETGNGEPVAEYVSHALRVPRAGADEGLTYEPRSPYRYSPEEYDGIRDLTLNYERRGSSPLSWEGIEVGERLPTLAKGPLDLTTIITYYSGALPYGYSPADTQWRLRDLAINHPERIPNNRAAAWVAETTWPGMGHYESDVAQAVGMPGVYDNGWMRSSWMCQLVTDWIGDRGMMKTMSTKALRPNLMNDTTFVNGTVTGKSVTEEGLGLLEFDITATNQLDEVTTTGTASATVPLS